MSESEVANFLIKCFTGYIDKDVDKEIDKEIEKEIE